MISLITLELASIETSGQRSIRVLQAVSASEGDGGGGVLAAVFGVIGVIVVLGLLGACCHKCCGPQPAPVINIVQQAPPVMHQAPPVMMQAPYHAPYPQPVAAQPVATAGVAVQMGHTPKFDPNTGKQNW